MAVKGAARKKEIMEKLLEVFPGSFLYNDGKEVRINGYEDNQLVQVKVVLTCAKVPVEGGSDAVLPGGGEVRQPQVSDGVQETVPQEPTTEEKERLQRLMAQLGLN
jgi:hypothetical protein